VASAEPYASQYIAPDRQWHQYPTTQFFTHRMSFLLPNQQHQSTEGSFPPLILKQNHWGEVSQRHSTGRGGGDSPAVIRGWWPLRFPGLAPPGHFATFGRVTTGYVDRPQAALGSRHRPGTASGTGWPSPPSPLRAPAGDPTPITLVTGMYLGEIESRSRPRNCDSRPGNAISQELTSLVCILHNPPLLRVDADILVHVCY